MERPTRFTTLLSTLKLPVGAGSHHCTSSWSPLVSTLLTPPADQLAPDVSWTIFPTSLFFCALIVHHCCYCQCKWPLSSSARQFSSSVDDICGVAGAVFTETYGFERAAYFTSPTDPVVPEGHSDYVDSCVASPPLHQFSFNRHEATYYEAEKRECLATRNAAACFDVSCALGTEALGVKVAI